MVGKFLSVDAAGTYLQTSNDPMAKPASVIDLATYHIKAGDFIGLEGQGKFIYDGSGGHTSQSLVGCFFAGATKVKPANFGQENNVVTLPSAVGGSSTDVPEDFNITFNPKIIVRVPLNATSLRLGPNDSYFGDNRGVGFGVLLTIPNKALAVPGSSQLHRDVSDSENEASHEAVELKLVPADYPNANKFLNSPFDDGTSSALPPQWRGWYGPPNGHWNPAASGFGFVRSGGKVWHAGWDIFAPRGSKLLSCVGPSKLDFLPGVSGYGNVAALRFKFKKETYTLIYAHCDKFVGSPRNVVAGEEIASVGCSGNSANESCGIDLTSGGRTDHVHVGLYKGIVIKDSKFEVDPAKLLSWQMV